MYAIEFEADIENGVVRIPIEYSRLANSHARVVVMVDERAILGLEKAPLDLRDMQIQAFQGKDGLELQRDMRGE